MVELPPANAPESLDWQAEVMRLNKIIRSLMDRAERGITVQGSDFSLFQTAVMLEDEVRRRTAELEAALRENEKINRALRASEAKFRGLVHQSLVGIVILEAGMFSYSNAKFDAIFGYSAAEVRALGPLDIVVASDRELIEEKVLDSLRSEAAQIECVFRGLRRDGGMIDVELHGSCMEIGGQRALIGMVKDVTQRIRVERELRALQESLREQSTHDPLTGLYNRRYLEETLARELILAQREGHPVSVIMGDLDHFKAVNDRFGHLAGDEVLRVFGNLMKQQVRGSDSYCRYGGEEFLLLLPRMSAANAARRAEQLRSAMAASPVTYGTASIAVTASFGVATFPQDGRSGDELIAAADSAMYAAKAAGRDRVCVSSGPVESAGI